MPRNWLNPVPTTRPVKLLLTCLLQVFKRQEIYFPDLKQLIHPHLRPAKPITLNYTIRCDADFHNNPKPTVYLLRVPANAPAQRDNPSDPLAPSSILAALASRDDLQRFKELDSHQASLVQAIASTKAKRDFYADMAHDPVNFTRKWMISQRTDLETVLGEGSRFEGDWASQVGFGGASRGALRGEWVKSGKDSVWGSKEIEEAVGMMVSKLKPGDKGF